MRTPFRSKIAGIGSYLPKKILSNSDLEKMVETNDQWIRERTGIERRHLAAEGEYTSDLCLHATERALQDAKMNSSDLDLILIATSTPDQVMPNTATVLQHKLGISGIPCLDVSAACSGFVYAISIADQYIKTGMYKNVLVIGSELHSTGLDMTTRGRGVSVIFGDGAGAAVLSREEDLSKGILSTHLHSEGQHAEELSLIAPGMGKRWVTDIIADNVPNDESYYPYMNGQFVFKNAVVRFSEVINEGLQANNLQVSDIDLLVPHQANLRISQFIQQKFRLTDDQVFNNIQKYGNTTAASIPIALTEAWEQGKIKSGDLVVLAAFGSGFTWGSVIIRW